MMELVQHLFYHLRWHRSVLSKVQASTCNPSLHSYATDVVQGKGKGQYYLALVLLQELSEWHQMQCLITFGILAPDFFLGVHFWICSLDWVWPQGRRALRSKFFFSSFRRTSLSGWWVPKYIQWKSITFQSVIPVSFDTSLFVIYNTVDENFLGESMSFPINSMASSF